MLLKDLTERYTVGGEIGRGSIGIVYQAVDQGLERNVAIKVLRPELLHHTRHRPRFLREAYLCARLGHPNIVPVFDVGQIDLPSSPAAPCLVMGLLAGRSLRTLIRSRRMSVPRMLAWFNQVCNGVGFAHEQGVMHRDIKPAHIFVGDFGQVVLTDWGLARTRRDMKPSEKPTVVRQDVTRVGDIVGTPAYMAPEQAEGRLNELDHRADIYALGAILYEILTGTRPYEAARSIDVLRALRRGPPDPPCDRAPHRHIPAALEAVCLQAMARHPADRFDSALDLAANIEAFLQSGPPVAPVPASLPIPVLSAPQEAADESRTLKVNEAARYLTDGRAEAAAYRRQVEYEARTTAEALRLDASLPYDAPRSERSEVWTLQSQARDALEQAAHHFGQAIDRLRQATTDESQSTPAREALARLHRDAWRGAEERGDVLSSLYHRGRAEFYDDGGLTDELAGHAVLSVHTSPPGTTVNLCTLDDRGAVWTKGTQLRMGTTPLSGRTVSARRLLVSLTAIDGLVVHTPLRLQPGESRVVELSLPEVSTVPDGFIFIPGGRFLFGADDAAPGAAKPRDIDIGSFCIARDSVSWEAYFEFLEGLAQIGRDPLAHQPRSRGESLVEFHQGKVRWQATIDAPPGAPIRWVSHTDAAAYAEWLGNRVDAKLRLPTESEWAYAAGGVDGRVYPWGLHFVPGLADTRRRGGRGPSPMQGFPDDESPFGMRGIAGGVRTWTATAAEMPGRYILRGGSWRAWPEQCRIGARATGAHDLTHQTIGIRLAADIPTALSHDG